MHSRWRSFVCRARGVLLVFGCLVLADGAVAQTGWGSDAGDPSADRSAWGGSPWRFRDQESSAEPGSGWQPTAPGPEDQEYHFRGDPGHWTGVHSGDGSGDHYRFRPLTERERGRMEYAPDGPDRSQDQRPIWPVEPPSGAWR